MQMTSTARSSATYSVVGVIDEAEQAKERAEARKALDDSIVIDEAEVAKERAKARAEQAALGGDSDSDAADVAAAETDFVAGEPVIWPRM
jgi:hypothetical protein